MRKIRTICSIIFLIILLAGLVIPLSARADVIYEPWDSFYEEKREECTYVNRNFTAAGPNGKVTVYEDPMTPTTVAELPNGTTMTISYTYDTEDGILWGCCDIWEQNITGWVPMDYLELIYDGISFEEEYGERLLAEEGSIGGEYRGKTIYFVQYPGSATYLEIPLQSGSDGYLPEYRTVYTDDAGVKWGKCGYYMGIKGYWINLNDPTMLPPAETEPVPTETVSATAENEIGEIVLPTPEKENEEIVPGGNGDLKLMVILGVAAVIVITAALLLVLKRKF